LALEYRLREFDQALAEIAQGMSAVVPVPFFNLFRWSELELLVCGRRDVDLDLLRSQLKLEGYRRSDKQIRWLFEALEQFSAAEREAFLRFVWGRSRLPLKAEDFAQPFKVAKMYRTPADQQLPEAHTCFFTLDLPQYSSLKVLGRRLKYAILNCRAIDTDHDVGNFSWE
jgi:HECT-domain (ubiquitin-transferase)